MQSFWREWKDGQTALNKPVAEQASLAKSLLVEQFGEKYEEWLPLLPGCDFSEMCRSLEES